MEALREKRKALRQRRIRTRDVASLAQIERELFEVEEQLEAPSIWGRLGLSAVRAMPVEEQVFTIDATQLLVDRLQDLLAIRLPFLARSASTSC